jgi:hypothetical protein
MIKDLKTRHLTIQTRWVKTWFGFMKRKAVPEIRISGIWLARTGYSPREKIKVTIRKKQLTITPKKA